MPGPADTQRVELGSALRDQVPEGAGVPFDHVLAAGGVRVTGAGASSIVLVDHEGFLMYPLDTEQASELGTGAVFVRAEDEGSEGSGDGGAPGGEGADS